MGADDQNQVPPVPAADLQSTLKDANGNFSSKRVAAFIALAAFIVLAFAGTFTTHKPDEYVMNDLMFIALGGLGMAATEWWANRRPG